MLYLKLHFTLICADNQIMNELILIIEKDPENLQFSITPS